MSAALDEWREGSADVFDEIEQMHRGVESAVLGRRVVTEQLNYAYAMLITAHFQRYCRALHTEVTQALVGLMPDPRLAEVLEGLLAGQASRRRQSHAWQSRVGFIPARLPDLGGGRDSRSTQPVEEGGARTTLRMAKRDSARRHRQKAGGRAAESAQAES